MKERKAHKRLVVECIDGLGAQLADYAAGLYYAERTGRHLEILSPLDPHIPGKEFPRPFHLGDYQLTVGVRKPTLPDRMFLPFAQRRRFLVRELEPLTSTRRVFDPGVYRFWPDLLDDVDVQTVYLCGSWHAWRYAHHVEARLRKDLRLRQPPHERNLRYAEQIGRLSSPVSVHIRLGDYKSLALPNAGDQGKTSIVLPVSYFKEAMAQMRNRYSDASFVLFSNEPDKARKLLGADQIALVVEGNGGPAAHEELWLMSCCHHHIIANSMYSWWGAWLNASPIKTVMAPKYWENTYQSYFPEICPPEWTLIDNLVAGVSDAMQLSSQSTDVPKGHCYHLGSTAFIRVRTYRRRRDQSSGSPDCDRK